MPSDLTRRAPDVAYQGEPGSYSEQATRTFFADHDGFNAHPCTTFSDMFTKIRKKAVSQIVVPIENNLAGTIHENLDHILRDPDLFIVGELDLPVRHCLLAPNGVSLSDVRAVASHPMALAQCTEYLHQNGLTSEVSYDTAGSAKLISKQDRKDLAAIASRRAAEIYNLNILAEGIQDEMDNYTRFLLVSTQPAKYVPAVPSKTSIAFALITSPGILYRALSVFAISNIDLNKIESRHIHTVREAIGPLPNFDISEKHWGYVFYVDILRHADETAVAAALKHLQEITTYYRLLGAYPAHISSE